MIDVFSGITAQQADGTYRKLHVSLDYDALLKLVREGRVVGWHLDTGPDGRASIYNAEMMEMSLTEMHKTLKWWADAYLITSMAKEHLISAEEARRQIAAL